MKFANFLLDGLIKKAGARAAKKQLSAHYNSDSVMKKSNNL
jgi:hypothetical protein